MLIQQHPIAAGALRDTQRVRGVGNLLNDILFPMDAFFGNVATGTVERVAGVGPDGTTNQAPQSFAGAFGGALGQTAGKFLTYAAVIGIGLWFLNRHRPRVP